MSQPDSSSDEAPGTTVARNSTIDAVVAACLCVIGVVEIVEARRLGAEWTSDGPGAGYFPFYIGLILARLRRGDPGAVAARAEDATTASSSTACS